MIVPKVLAGYTGHRWPVNDHDVATKSYVEGAVDKVWLPSVTELNIVNGIDWNKDINDAWTNPSDEAGSIVFEYFKNYGQYANPLTGNMNSSISEAVKTVRTSLAKNGSIGNFSIPVYNKGTTTVKTSISTTANTSDQYWTRSPVSYWYRSVRMVDGTGKFSHGSTVYSYGGIRPCVILKY